MNKIIERIIEKHKLLIGLTAAFIAITIPLVLLVDDFIHDVILVPIAYYTWLAGIILKALPQNCFITFLIVLCIALAIPSLRKSHPKKMTAESKVKPVPGEVTLWEQRLQYLRSGSYSSSRFAYHIGYLVVHILAYEERLTTREVIKALEAGAYTIPGDVRRYILMGIGSNTSPSQHPFWHQLVLWLKRVNKSGQRAQTSKQYNDVKAVLQYIEQQLKIVEQYHDMTESMLDSAQPEVNDVK